MSNFLDSGELKGWVASKKLLVHFASNVGNNAGIVKQTRDGNSYKNYKICFTEAMQDE